METTSDNRPDHQIAREEFQALVDSLKLKVECSSATGSLGDKDKEGRRWEHLSYTMTINGQPFEYHMGIGHIPWDRVDAKREVIKGVPSFRVFLNSEAWSFLRTHQSNPYAKFVEQGLWIRVCEKVANLLKVQPSVVDVLSSVAMDAKAPHLTFEDWADNFGYDKDSRKAEETWRACGDNARKALKFLSREVLVKMQELAGRL